MGKVRTVLGDIDSSKLGFTHAHEHIFKDYTSSARVPENESDLVDWQKAVQMLNEFKALGGGCIVDAQPRTRDGRDPARLQTISRLTGIHLIACTGMFFEKNSTTKEFTCQDLQNMTPTELTDFYIKETSEGMDGTDIKAGWIKGGSMYCYITPLQEKSLRAAVRASKVTGVPVHTHTTTGTFQLEQCEIVEDEGMDMTRFGVAHVDRNPDFWLQKKVAERGSYLIFDSGPGKIKYFPDGVRVELLKRLVDAGFENQIMLAMDMGKKTHHTVYGYGPGWEYIKERFIPRLLDEGFSQSTIDNFMIHNPARFYSLTGS